MQILSLDMATKTGWCFYDSETKKIIESGVQDFSKKRGESNGVMYLRFRGWLKLITDLHKPELIAYEQAHMRGGAATEICIALQTRAQERAVEIGIESIPVRANTLKKFASGKGNAGKDIMIKLATKYLNRPVIDDNEADAIHIARWAAKEVA